MSYDPAINAYCLVDCFTCEPGFPRSWAGLDLASAEESTPRLYGVSFGNGNDGVSHMYPDYYVRTCEPYTLAQAAMWGEFLPGEGQAWAQEATEIDGEAAYTIYATIYDPPAEDQELDHSECEDGEDCDGCDQCEPGESWSSVNGAWMICEVFLVESEEDIRTGKYIYDNLSEAFCAELLALARE